MGGKAKVSALPDQENILADLTLPDQKNILADLSNLA